MDADFLSLKQWLDETWDVPLEAMDAFFNARIGDYEEHMSPWTAHYRWMAELIPADTKTILDIGCGTGLELDIIFARLPDLQVTGIDMAEEMLSKLREKHGNRNLTLIRDDYFRHPFGESVYDGVISFETLHHFPAETKTRLLEKICRALRPGGFYLECDYIASTQAIEDLVFAEAARRRERDRIPPDTFVHFDTPLTLEHEMAAMRDAGFSTVELVGFLPDDNHTAMIRGIK
ncbi:MAG: methyltransferase domain-containing protein [Lentisphaeria bacterium]|nr:methyltransferase domain-containing protein [Lentisphaeria bacterium]